MKEKLLQFFTGKMSKTIYISIASAVVCGAVVITSIVIVHNNNQKIDSMQESLSALQENITELSSESATESVSNMGDTDSDAQAKAPNGEPAGDKALQYLAEYDKLTKEYERKRAELAQETLMTATERQATLHPKPQLLSPDNGMFKTKEDYDVYLEEFQRRFSQWEQESQQAEIEESEAQRKADEENARASEAQRKLDALDAQYEKDVAALKAKYGM